MIRPSFLSPTERLELEVCVRSQREYHGIARRANALLLLDDGKACQVIAEFLYLDDDTVRGWHKTYRENGWDALAVVFQLVKLMSVHSPMRLPCFAMCFRVSAQHPMNRTSRY
jgi:hypothetical protein